MCLDDGRHNAHYADMIEAFASAAGARGQGLFSVLAAYIAK